MAAPPRPRAWIEVRHPPTHPLPGSNRMRGERGAASLAWISHVGGACARVSSAGNVVGCDRCRDCGDRMEVGAMAGGGETEKSN
jgi:hypothetical protein